MNKIKKEPGKNKKIEIIYEDRDVAVINKPAGISVHSDGKNSEETLVDWIKKDIPKAKKVGENMFTEEGKEIERPGIVHRLDKQTSGALIIAKSQESYEFLKDQFKARIISKMYIAFADGAIKTERGIIRKPIGRSRSDARKRSTKADEDKLKDAETVYRNIKISDGVTLLALWPKTGRTHQIRVHLKSIGHPVVADALYGKRQNKLGFKRLALHARSIAFQTVSGKKMTIKAPFAADFQKVIADFDASENELLK